MLQIAKILKSNGTDGGVLLGVRDIDLSEIDIKEPVYIEFDGLPVPFFIESLERHGSTKAVAHLTDISSLEDAEEIVGKAVFADIEFEEDEAEEDFTGWTVYDSGRKIGVITGFEDIPGNYCVYLKRPFDEVLIPLHEDFIIEADPDKKELFLKLPEGLL